MPKPAPFFEENNQAGLGRNQNSLPDLAYDAIVEAIFDGRFQPSTPLSIDALAREFNISNTPVREALSRAASERLVYLAPNRGYRVAPRLTEQEFHQLFDVRYLLEIHGIETGKILSQTVEQIKGMVAKMGQPTAHDGPRYQDYKVFNQVDHFFHLALVSLSRNKFLIQSWQDLHFHLHVGRLYSGEGVIDYSQAMQEHQAIVDALQAGSKTDLIQQVGAHIKNAEKRLTPLLNYNNNNQEKTAG